MSERSLNRERERYEACIDDVGGTVKQVRPAKMSRHGSNHIFNMEVLFRGTESYWIR